MKPRQEQAAPEPLRASVFRVVVAVPVVASLLVAFARDTSSFLNIRLLLWAIILAFIELYPVPAWRGLQLSLGFPIRLGLAILYAPWIAAGVAFVGTFDPREVRRERPLLAALFDRAQIALAVLAGSAVFHSLAIVSKTESSPWYVLLPVTLLATVCNYGINVGLIAAYMRIAYGLSLSKIFGGLRLGSPLEFALSYTGLSLVGIVIARLYVDVDFWAVAVFILPLLFARGMFFRTMALEEAHKDLKDREKVLRALSNRMAEERHDERMQIAGYLHDDLA